MKIVDLDLRSLTFASYLKYPIVEIDEDGARDVEGAERGEESEVVVVEDAGGGVHGHTLLQTEGCVQSQHYRGAHQSRKYPHKHDRQPHPGIGLVLGVLYGLSDGDESGRESTRSESPRGESLQGRLVLRTMTTSLGPK